MGKFKCDRKAYAQAAAIASKSGGLEVYGSKLKSLIQANASANAKTGRFARSIKIRRDTHKGNKNVKDVVVYSTDPAGLSIEYGHIDKKTGKHIQGKYIFTAARMSMGGR